MLEYQKLILHKVSFSHELFERELKKGVAQLPADEAQKLLKWAQELFGRRHHKAFQRIAHLHTKASAA